MLALVRNQYCDFLFFSGLNNRHFIWEYIVFISIALLLQRVCSVTSSASARRLGSFDSRLQPRHSYRR